MTIRKDDSLLITAHSGYPEGNIVTIVLKDEFGNQTDCIGTGVDETAYVVPFPVLGTYHAVSFEDVNSNEIHDAGELVTGTYEIEVVSYNLPEYIASEIGFQRSLYVDNWPTADGQDFSLEATSDQQLDVTLAGETDDDVFLKLRANAGNEPVLEAWLSDHAGGRSQLDAEEIATFNLYSLNGSVIPVVHTYPDGSRLLRATLRMEPIRPNLDIKLQIFVSGATFVNGGLTQWINTNDFVPDEGGESTPGGSLEYYLYKSVHAPTGPCSTRAIYQVGTRIGN